MKLCKKLRDSRYQNFPASGTTGCGSSDASSMCDVCGKIFASAQYMMTHKKMHETGAFLCNECGKEFDTKIKLNRYAVLLSANLI